MTIAEAALEEVQMYRFHAIQPDAIHLPHMRHSLFMQLFRRDPLIYRLAVTLRGDHASRLIAIPTIMNEWLTAEEVSGNSVQFAFELDRPNDNTEWEKGSLLAIAPDEAANILNGGRVFFPTYAALQNDQQVTDFPGYTANELSRCHCELTTSRKVDIPRFPSAIELPSLGPLSDALVGQTSWNSPLVRTEQEMMLKDNKTAMLYYKNWIDNAAETFIKTFNALQDNERAIYQQNSYFKWREDNPTDEFPTLDADPDPKWDADEYEKYCLL